MWRGHLHRVVVRYKCSRKRRPLPALDILAPCPAQSDVHGYSKLTLGKKFSSNLKTLLTLTAKMFVMKTTLKSRIHPIFV
jgi:hypothetical protein